MLDEGALDERLRALAHPDRRLFLRACLEEERAAGDLATLSSLSAATVSEHLKVLRKTGLLTLNQQGRFWRYRTDTGVLAALVDAIASLEKNDGTGS